jgi:hypothetical protein
MTKKNPSSPTSKVSIKDAVKVQPMEGSKRLGVLSNWDPKTTTDVKPLSSIGVLGDQVEGLHPGHRETYIRTVRTTIDAEAMDRVLKGQDGISMGCHVAEPPPCPLCDEQDKGKGDDG